MIEAIFAIGGLILFGVAIWVLDRYMAKAMSSDDRRYNSESPPQIPPYGGGG